MNLFIWLNCISRYLSLKILPFHWNWKRGKWVIFFFPEKRMSLLLLISNNYMQSSACLCRLFCQLILETTKWVSASSLVPYQQNHHPCWLVHVKIVGTLSNHDDDGIVKRESHKFAYLTTKNNSFARFARAFFIFFSHFADVLVLSTTWNDLFCSCGDDVGISWQTFNFVVLFLKRWFQFNSRIVRKHFASVMTLNNCEIITETRNFIFRWRSRWCRRRLCLSSLVCYVNGPQSHFLACFSFKLHDPQLSSALERATLKKEISATKYISTKCRELM